MGGPRGSRGIDAPIASMAWDLSGEEEAAMGCPLMTSMAWDRSG